MLRWTIRVPEARIGGGDVPVPKVDPKDPDTIYVASVVTWKSTDAGKTWYGLRGAPGGDDYQNVCINPEQHEDHRAGERPGRDHLAERRADVDAMVQPGDGCRCIT